MKCTTCGGSMLPDRLDNDWRCLMCARPRRRRPTKMLEEKPRRTFRRVWDVDPAELLVEHGRYGETTPV